MSVFLKPLIDFATEKGLGYIIILVCITSIFIITSFNLIPSSEERLLNKLAIENLEAQVQRLESLQISLDRLHTTVSNLSDSQKRISEEISRLDSSILQIKIDLNTQYVTKTQHENWTLRLKIQNPALEIPDLR